MFRRYKSGGDEPGAKPEIEIKVDPIVRKSAPAKSGKGGAPAKSAPSAKSGKSGKSAKPTWSANSAPSAKSTKSAAAKSGTAELGITKMTVNSWITGYFPYNNPEYAFAVVMERGPVSNEVGAVAVMRSTLDWMNVHTPEYFK